MKMGIVSRTDIDEAIELDEIIIKYLLENSIELEIDSKIINKLPAYAEFEVPIEDMVNDIVISVGGDGTVLYCQHILSPKKIPILSINMGTVGFLTEVEPEDLFECFDKLLSYDFFIEERMQLDVLCGGEWFTVLNELVIMTDQPAKMLDLRVCSNGEIVDHVRADGLIISTPSGSTAYAMSAGGPIVDPKVDVAIIIPICPFKLNTRPKIVPGDSTITVELLTDNKDGVAVLDGSEKKRIEFMDEIKLKKSDTVAYFVRFNKNFYSNVNSKLIVE